MIKIIIRNDSYLITEEQCKWFKTLEHALEYMPTDKSRLIELPTVIADQSIDIDQFQQLVKSYQMQITRDIIDYTRPRSILEHYLDGILDDIDEHNQTILNYLLMGDTDRFVVTLKLYQLISNCNIPTRKSMSLLFDDLTTRVIKLGSLDVFIHLFEMLKNDAIFHIVSKCGQLSMLKYLHQHGYSWDEDICSYAAMYGHLNCLQYAHENGCPWDIHTSIYAASGGYLDCLQYAHENGCPIDSYTCSYAAGHGHLDCLKYAHEHGCSLDDWVCIRSAEFGHLNCLQYAHDNGCQCGTSTCAYAAANGHLDCLQYLHQQGCSWDEETCFDAVLEGHLNCLKYAHEHGCSWNKYIYLAAENSGNPEIMEYLRNQGCPVV